RSWPARASRPAPPACWRCSTPSACSCRRRTPSPTAAPAASPAPWPCTRPWPAAGRSGCPSASGSRGAGTCRPRRRTRRASPRGPERTRHAAQGEPAGAARYHSRPSSRRQEPPVSHDDDTRNGVARTQAEQAVRTLLQWAGEDPAREGLLDTPHRVVDAYTEWFSGYGLDPEEYMARTFEEVCGYDEMIVLRDIEFESHCEHHMAPIIGRVHVGYLPDGKVVGISKLARVVEAFAKRFQVQEKMTAQIAGCIQRALAPHGVGVVVDGSHECMTTRGVHKRGVSMVTSTMLG